MATLSGKEHGENLISQIAVGSRDAPRLRSSCDAADDMTRLLGPDTPVPEQDCGHWLPGGLDLEPETCWCLRHGEALPCAACWTGSPTTIGKELS